jgi:hypothetical protein
VLGRRRHFQSRLQHINIGNHQTDDEIAASEFQQEDRTENKVESQSICSEEEELQKRQRRI